MPITETAKEIHRHLSAMCGGLFIEEKPPLSEAQLDPNSDHYIGHINAVKWGVAKCLCDGDFPDISCPFHGR